MYYAFDGAPPPLRAGAAHATIYPYGPFPVGGGATIMLGLQNEREWRVFCAQVLRQAELAEDPRFLSNSQRTANREALRTLIVDAFAGLDIDQVTQRLEDAQIANARVNDMAGVWAHPQLQARQRWRGWQPGRRAAGAVAARHQQRLRAAHGSRAGRGRKHRRGASIIGVRARRGGATARRGGRMTHPIVRTALFVPASRPERIPAALASGADAVIVDLEDAVEHLARTARAKLCDFLGTHPQARLWVRINDAATPWHEDDLGAARQGRRDRHPAAQGRKPGAGASCGTDGAAGHSHHRNGARRAQSCGSRGHARRGAAGLGSLDYALDLGLSPDSPGAGIVLDHARIQVLLQTRAAGLPPALDGVFPGVQDTAGLARAQRPGRSRWAFGGMLCIHPAQVPLIHQARAGRGRAGLGAARARRASRWRAGRVHAGRAWWTRRSSRGPGSWRKRASRYSAWACRPLGVRIWVGRDQEGGCAAWRPGAASRLRVSRHSAWS